MADNLTPEQRRYTMSRMRSKDTKPEVAVRKLVHARGLRFRKHVKHLPGKPDIVFSRARVVVFVDGDFWHGWNFDEWKEKLAPYWRQKIEGNMARDERHAAALEAEGWLVLRVWQHEIKKDAAFCVDRIEAAVRERRPKPKSHGSTNLQPSQSDSSQPPA